MLWTSTRIMHEYIPATIIMESPGQVAGAQPAEQSESAPAPQTEPCTKCGDPATYVKEHDSFFCQSCNEYVVFPKDDMDGQPDVDDLSDMDEESDMGGGRPALNDPRPPVRSCKSCKGDLRYIEEYERFYCDSCKIYD